MRLAWALAVYGCLASLLCLPSLADESPQDLTRQQTFVVQSLIDGDKANIGGGVVVARDGDVLTIATAAHVIKDGGPMRILDTSRQAYYAVIDVRQIPAGDLALVRVRAQPQSPQPVALATAAPGEPVWVWGHPDNAFWTLATGTVTRVDARLPHRDDTPRITITCDRCAHGDSGAGVFNAKGQLVGILTASWRVPPGPVLFVEVQPVAEFLPDLNASDNLAKLPAPKTP